MTEKQLFLRDYKVTVGERGQEGKEYTDLRVVFEVEKTSESSPNKAKIEIYNLSGTSRKEYQKKGLGIRLDAGYQGLMEVLFIGDVHKPKFKRNNADILTTFEAGDGERALVNTVFNKSYGAGTRFVQIVQDIADTLGIAVGTVIGIKAEVYNAGVTFSGSAKKALDTMTAKQDLEWSVQNNTIQILPKTAHLGEEAIFISKTTGLIGVPSAENQDSVKFSSLLNPKLQPGALVQLESDQVNGFYKLKKVKFDGDSHGDKWQADCEGVKINAAQVFPPGAFKEVS